jgi:ceramide glucosyltransferase
MAVAALAFQGLCLLGAWDFRRQQRSNAAAKPPVSILKPLKGADPQIYEGFRSHCVQAYPEYEIVFGVNDATDDAVPYVERLQREFPKVPIRLVVCSEVLGANRKVSNVVRLLREAKYEHVLINDSDIRVPQGYLAEAMGWFADANVGMVTCMYRAIAGRTLWSKCEALGISMDFMPPVLAARFLEGRVYFGLGSTLAVSKSAVAGMGGLETIVDHLGDDYELGTRIADSGKQVVLAESVVETFVHDYSFRQFLDHQLRWARTVRSSRPAGYMGMIITFGVLWSAVAVAVSAGAVWSWAALAANVAARLLVTKVVADGILDDKNVWRLMWLMPFRDLLAPMIWAGGLFGDKIVWRGETFRLERGKLCRD